jgi:hypothetical protein
MLDGAPHAPDFGPHPGPDPVPFTHDAAIDTHFDKGGFDMPHHVEMPSFFG